MIRPTVLVNGVASNHCDVMDRALQYGDGLFETLLALKGVPQCWQQHMNRLTQGCQRLRIAPPVAELLRREVLGLTNQDKDEIIKIIISRGVGERGYGATRETIPTRIIMVSPFVSTYKPQGLRVTICQTRWGSNPTLAGMKHLNRLEQVMAKTELNDEVDEGVMLSQTGHVISGVQTNIFLVKEGQLLTPDLSICGIDGVTRGEVMRTAGQLGIEVVITKLLPRDLVGADELFVTNSLVGVQWVARFEQQTFSLGPLTKRIREIVGQAHE